MVLWCNLKIVSCHWLCIGAATLTSRASVVMTALELTLHAALPSNLIELTTRKVGLLAEWLRPQCGKVNTIPLYRKLRRRTCTTNSTSRYIVYCIHAFDLQICWPRDTSIPECWIQMHAASLDAVDSQSPQNLNVAVKDVSNVASISPIRSKSQSTLTSSTNEKLSRAKADFEVIFGHGPQSFHDTVSLSNSIAHKKQLHDIHFASAVISRKRLSESNSHCSELEPPCKRTFKEACVPTQTIGAVSDINSTMHNKFARHVPVVSHDPSTTNIMVPSTTSNGRELETCPTKVYFAALGPSATAHDNRLTLVTFKTAIAEPQVAQLVLKLSKDYVWGVFKCDMITYHVHASLDLTHTCPTNFGRQVQADTWILAVHLYWIHK